MLSMRSANISFEAKEQAAETVEKGEKRAAAEREKMLADAKDDIIDATLDATGKLLGRVVTDEDNRRIIESYFG